MIEKFVNITAIDTQYSFLKIQNKKIEKDLLSSIAEKDIKEPLLGIWSNERFILVDGFKRYRCAIKLHISQILCRELAQEKCNAFISVLRTSNDRTLHILEQAKFLNELCEYNKMTTADIAYSLNKSKSWVSARLTLLKELTPLLEKKIFLGQFPVWVAMGTLHQFKRLIKITNIEIDKFVEAVSNKNLSVRDVDLLAQGYFKGGDKIRSQIENGNLSWSISKMKEFQKNNYDYNEEEKRILRDLEVVQKYIGRLIFKLPQLKTISSNFLSTAEIIVEGILSKQSKFNIALNNFIQESKDD